MCSLEEKLSRAQREKHSIQNVIEEELQRKGWWLAPLSSRLQGALLELGTAASPSKSQLQDRLPDPKPESKEVVGSAQLPCRLPDVSLLAKIGRLS